MARTPIITLTTDFGLNDHFIGTVKGVILSIVPEAVIVDISHSVQAFDVLDGALTISQAYSYFPVGTTHVVVVDPGVGSERRAIIASTERHYFVAPDNGVLSMVFEREERMWVRQITAQHYFLQPRSDTFHARDVFAPIAAYLAKGVDPEKMGEEIQDYVKFASPKPKAINENTLRGVVLKVDRFGNLVTNITPQDAPMLFEEHPQDFKIVVGKKEINSMQKIYANARPGELFGILGSMGYLEVAANRGSAYQLIGSGKGTEVMVVIGEAAAASNGS